MFLLIEGFSSFRFLLSTDNAVLMADSVTRIARNVINSPIYNSTIISNSSITMMEEIIVGVAGNPIFTNPVIITFLSVLSMGINLILFISSVVLVIVYVLIGIPVFGHTLLMLYTFHRDTLGNLIKIMVYDGVDSTETASTIARIVTPYLLQGIVIQGLLMTATFPIIVYRILKRVGFYDRIPNIHS